MEIRKINLGTHNSCTSYPVKGFWSKLISWTNRCQNLSIQEQYDLGARYFDIRIRPGKHGITVWHGIVEFKVNIKEIFEYLNSKGDCIVRLVLENRKWERGERLEMMTGWLEAVHKVLQRDYPNIEWYTVGSKNPWNLIYTNPNTEIVINHNYKMILGWSVLIPWPKFWAKQMKKKQSLPSEGGSFEYFVVDFIEDIV
jgi:hypothetical protein